MSFRSTLRALFLIRKGVIGGLDEASAGSDPLALFERWFADARRSGLLLPEATTLSTATPEGKPSGRLVLLKSFADEGFVFYTNFESRKARELDINPHAALTFHWPVLQRQVRVEGGVQRTSSEQSAAYFRTRPRGSQLGAWASTQSGPLADRGELEARVEEMRRKFAGVDVPLPPSWGGYRLRPERIEFWQGRLDRLHDRILFSREGQGWIARRLSP